MIATGLSARISAKDIVRGTISEYTCASRTRRAISCAYCAPRSTTSTLSWWVSSAVTSAPVDARWCALAAHADALRALQRLALGLQRRRDHHLGLLELLHRLVAGGGHRGAERTEQVERAVVVVRGPDEDLLQRALL